VGKYLHFSEEEAQGQEQARVVQEMAQDWISRSIYYGVPIRSRRKTRAVNSAIWIEPVPEALEQSLIAKASGGQVCICIQSLPLFLFFIQILFSSSNRIHWIRCLLEF
jgi:hypothetical protein